MFAQGRRKIDRTTSLLQKQQLSLNRERTSLAIERNEMLCEVGESGSGESVMTKSILNLLPAPHVREADGAIQFERRDLLRKWDERSRFPGTSGQIARLAPSSPRNSVLALPLSGDGPVRGKDSWPNRAWSLPCSPALTAARRVPCRRGDSEHHPRRPLSTPAQRPPPRIVRAVTAARGFDRYCAW